MDRLDLIKKLALQVQNNLQNKPVSLSGIERQAVMLADMEYVKTDKKVVDSISELDFN